MEKIQKIVEMYKELTQDDKASFRIEFGKICEEEKMELFRQRIKWCKDADQKIPFFSTKWANNFLKHL